jgi:predicted ATP-grasp superfamily ATP-dependent carboligase
VDDRPEAVVLGLEESGLGVVRALARHGIPVRAVAHAPHPARATRYATVVQARAWGPEAIVEELLALGRTLDARAPLFLCGDEPVLWLSRLRAELEPFFHLSLPSHEVVELLMDKTRFVAHAAERGWPVPRSRIVHDPDGLERAIDELDAPLILKPAQRNFVYRRRLLPKAFIATGPGELREAYGRIAAAESAAVVQEFVPGGDDRIGFCLGYAPRDGGAPVTFAGRKLLQWPPRCGNTAVAAPAPGPWRGPLSDLTRSIWDDVSYRGLGSLECKFDPRTERPLITEPTVGRVNLQSEIAPLNGVNLPVRMYCDLTGRPVPPERDGPPTKLVFGSSLRSSLAAYRSGSEGERPSKREILEGRVRFALFRRDDPGPAAAAARERIRRLASGARRRLRVSRG